MKESTNQVTKVLLNISLVLVIILLLGLTKDFLKPLYSVILYILGPIILSVYIYYALRPLKLFLNRYIRNETLCAVISFLVFLLLIVLLFSLLSNVIISQVRQLMNYNLNLDQFLKANNEVVTWLQDHLNIEKHLQDLEAKLQEVAGNLPGYLGGAFSSVSSFATQCVMGLLCIFYLLKDEALLSQLVEKAFRGPYQKRLNHMGIQIHETLKTYISSQLLVACVLGTMTFIGFLIIGLPYSVLMAIIALFTNFIPFIGPIIGCVPAVLVAMSVDFSMVVKAILVTVVVQQLESNLITPNIMGNKMDIHPFVVIVVVLISMNLFGVLGALIATPLYMAIKIIVETILAIRDDQKKLCRISDKDFYQKNWLFFSGDYVV